MLAAASMTRRTAGTSPSGSLREWAAEGVPFTVVAEDGADITSVLLA